jgi:uncharacterized membrane protein YphA (DoxX/SURF4 family)
MNSVLSKVARVMLASAFVYSGLNSFADLGASQLGYAASGLKNIGITDPSVAAACFWIAKTLEALGGLLLAGAPLLSLIGISSERAAEKLGAAMLLVFIAAVTPCLHPPLGDVQQFLKVRRAARRASDSHGASTRGRRDLRRFSLSGAHSRASLARLRVPLVRSLALLARLAHPLVPFSHSNFKPALGLQMVMLFGGLLYIVANDAPKASTDSKKGK